MDTKLLKRSLFPALALASMSCVPLVAEASTRQSAPAVPSMTVSYGDLNLATPEGASILYRRIRGAARMVCGEQGRSLFEQSLWTSCLNEAIAHAVAKVNNPRLSSVHSRTSQRPT